MKVIVGKMPGGRATEVEIPEGGTVLDAIKAAGYEADLNQGFEARMNNSQTELSSSVRENSIITLTSKITGNSGISAISVVPVATNAACERFIVLTPTIVHDFINLPDVKDMILRLKKTVLPAPIKCIIADSVNLKVSKPIDISIYGTTVLCADFTYAIDTGNYVVFCDDNIANKIYTMDSLSAITYIEEYIPAENRNKDSLAASRIPEDVKEIEVKEGLATDCFDTTHNKEAFEYEDVNYDPEYEGCCEDCEKETCEGDCDNTEGHCCDNCVPEAIEYENYSGSKENNPHCNPSECCEDCEEETCGQCHRDCTNTKYCNDESCDCNDEGCDCCGETDVSNIPENHITIKELVDMCERLKIDLSISVPGASSRFNR